LAGILTHLGLEDRRGRVAQRQARAVGREIRDVLRAKHECGLSHETIARASGIAKGSVANQVAAAQAAGLSAAGARELDDAALLERLHPKRYMRRGCQEVCVRGTP
jgi:hypothetical protein